jgi:hypothetical protein
LRQASITASVSSTDWMRFTAFCTTGSKSCTPRLARLKPMKASASMSPASTVRGSISMEKSRRFSGAKWKWRLKVSISSPSWPGGEEVRGAAAQVQLHHLAVAVEQRRDQRDLAHQAVQVDLAARASRVITRLQPQ